MMNKQQIIPQQTARPQPQFNNVPYQPTPMTPGQAEYWRLNGANGQAANEAINRMPFVLDPASMFGQDRSQIMASMYQPKPVEGDAAQPQAPATPSSPAEQMLALLQSNPELLPIIMQQMQPQQQQTVTPSNQGP